MNIVRNFIQVSGITPAEELPDKIWGQILQHSDVETLYIPESSSPAKSIFQVMVRIRITSNRRIDAPLGTIVVIDGVKEYKIIYSGNEESGKASIAAVNVPYNTFIEVQNKNTIIDNINIHIVDAYFELLDRRRIYSHILYLVDVEYGEGNEKKTYVRVDYESGNNVLLLDEEDNLLGQDNIKNEEVMLSFNSSDSGDESSGIPVEINGMDSEDSSAVTLETDSMDHDESRIDIESEYL